jgi:hypothetical protein
MPLPSCVGDDERLTFYPHTQTLAGMLESFEENLKVGIREEPRITEQARTCMCLCIHVGVRIYRST